MLFTNETSRNKPDQETEKKNTMQPLSWGRGVNDGWAVFGKIEYGNRSGNTPHYYLPK